MDTDPTNSIKPNTTKTMFKYKKFTPEAIPPTRSTERSVGYDLYSLNAVTIGPNEVASIDTGVGVTPPSGTFAKIETKSSYAIKNMNVEGVVIEETDQKRAVLGGIIDPDYTGRIIVLLRNARNESFKVEAKSKVAQLIFYVYDTPDGEETTELEVTKRGAGGFGSTGSTHVDSKKKSNESDYPDNESNKKSKK